MITQRIAVDGQLTDDPITGQKVPVVEKSFHPRYVLQIPWRQLRKGAYHWG